MQAPDLLRRTESVAAELVVDKHATVAVRGSSAVGLDADGVLSAGEIPRPTTSATVLVPLASCELCDPAADLPRAAGAPDCVAVAGRGWGLPGGLSTRNRM